MRVSIGCFLMAMGPAILLCACHGESGSAAGSSSTSLEGFAPEKGPAHQTAIDGSPTEQWTVVAPGDPRSLYDAAYFQGRWYVLHGEIVRSQKAVVSEVNWLSSSGDGVDWDTRVLTSEAFESYTDLSSNGDTLLMAGTRHVASLGDEGIGPIPELDQSTYPPQLVPHPEGYVAARFGDILWLSAGLDVEVTYEQKLAQFRTGILAPDGFFLFGVFASLQSTDGRHWKTAAHPPCAPEGCLVASAAFGKDTYVVAYLDKVYTSSDGAQWDAAASPGEAVVRQVDFTAGLFFLRSVEDELRVSQNGKDWSEPLRLSEPGPAACRDRCVVAAGRLLLPPDAV